MNVSRFSIVLFLSSLISVYLVHSDALSQEKKAREALSCGDAALSIVGDSILAQGGDTKLANGCKLFGSLCNMTSHLYNPYVPNEVKSLRFLSDGVRTLSLATNINNNGSQKSDNFLLSSILRLVSVGAELFAIKKEYLQNRDEYDYHECGNDKNTKQWALARLISAWSRAIADWLSVPNIGKAGCYFSAVVDSYELLRVLNQDRVINQDWFENNREGLSEEELKKKIREDLKRARIERFRTMRGDANVKNELQDLWGSGESAWTICSVCLDEEKSSKLLRKDLAMYPCGLHICCKECIKRWRQSNNSSRCKECPGCARNFNDNEIIW